MEYEKYMKKLEHDGTLRTVIGISSIYEKLRKQNFIKWIKHYPEHWEALCKSEKKDITPEYAEEVMQTLLDSNILELQLVWLFKCGDKIDLLGNAVQYGRN